jgi:hypothetical protein
MPSNCENGNSPLRARRTNSKTGCKTCKIRKVKCDEGRPACIRCLSTGRICDGYGVWGGGNSYASRHQITSIRPSCIAAAGSTRPRLVFQKALSLHPDGSLDYEEKYHLDWFWKRTSRKIPGAFYSDSDNSLLYQATASDPAVTHAILAACSAHRDSDKSLTLSTPTRLRQDEGFALKQYNKAISHLQRHLETKDTISLRITLFSCVAFVFVELFRSHYQTARRHLEHGLRVLQEGSKLWKSSGFATILANDWAFGTLRRLYVQFSLFGLSPRRPWLAIDEALPPLSKIKTFPTVFEARERLENIMLKIHEAVSMLESNHLLPKPEDTDIFPATKTLHAQLSSDLKAWMLIHDATFTLSTPKIDGVTSFAYLLLRQFHTLSLIQLSPLDLPHPLSETHYDTQSPLFHRLMAQHILLRNIASNANIRRRYFGTETGQAHSIGDVGPIMVLFYMATKCRAPRYRRQAIWLMEETHRKEGIWDTSLASGIARMVVQLEERGMEGMGSLDEGVDDVLMLDMKEVEQLMEGKVPKVEDRVSVVNVVLPDRPWEPVFVDLRRLNAGSGTYCVERMLVEPMQQKVINRREALVEHYTESSGDEGKVFGLNSSDGSKWSSPDWDLKLT